MRHLMLLPAILMLGGPACAQTAPGGTATGNLTVDGRPIPLKFAYIVDVDDQEGAGLPLAGPTRYLVFVLTDRALPAGSVTNRNAPYGERKSPAELFAPAVKSPADEVRGMVLKLEPNLRKVFQASLLYPGADSTFTVSSTDYPDQLTDLKREGEHLSGTAVLAEPQDTYFKKGPKRYQYRVSFRAPVVQEPPVTQKWEGQEALDSPPVQAIRQYLDAAKKGDAAGLRRLTAKSHQAYLDKPETLKFLKQADASKLATQVKRVVVRGDLATVLIVSAQPSLSQVSMRLVKEDGGWKLYWP